MTSPLRTLRQRGAAAVEAALLLPFSLAVAFVATDLHRLSNERAQLEQSAGSAAMTLAMQRNLTRAGVDALVDVVTLGRPQHYQVVMLSVRQSRRIEWGLQRGAVSGCAQVSDGRDYLGPLPEPEPVRPPGTPASTDTSTVSMLVVQVCRSAGDIRTHGNLWLPPLLHARAVNRIIAGSLPLDVPLTQESQASGLVERNR